MAETTSTKEQRPIWSHYLRNRLRTTRRCVLWLLLVALTLGALCVLMTRGPGMMDNVRASAVSIKLNISGESHATSTTRNSGEGPDRVPQQQTNDVKACSMEQRRQWIRNICKRNKWAEPPASFMKSMKGYSDKFLVDDVHKVMYCSIPKVGSTTFLGLFQASGCNISVADLAKTAGKGTMHSVDNLRKCGMKLLSKMGRKEQQHALNNYFKFIVVRHPIDRLLSAYRDRIEVPRQNSGGTMYFFDKRRKAIKNFPGITRNLYVNNTFAANITEFLRLVGAGYPRWFNNVHWQDYFDRCKPCNIQYDSVIRMESLPDEIPEILEKLPGPDGKPNILPLLNQKRTTAIEDKLSAMSSALHDLDAVTLNRIMTTYRRDFEIFGYEVNRTSRTGHCLYRDSTDSKGKLPTCC